MTITRARLARMGMRLAAALACLALLLAACPLPGLRALAASDGMIRVLLTRLGTRSSLTFVPSCAYYVNGNTDFPIPAGTSATVSVADGALTLSMDGQTYPLGGSCTLARGQSGNVGLRFTSPSMSNVFAGDLILSASGGSLTPILNIYIEDYLYGVVAYEMSNSWPLEALKAQAVAARNYALRCMSSRASRAYHVVDNTSDQVFKGYNGSYARVIQAVDETRGMALYASGSLAACYYSASNGGQTESTRNAWGGSLSYSVVKDDPYDLANASARSKTAVIRRDAQDLNANLLNALLAAAQGAGLTSASITGISAIEPHTPRYASPSRLYTKLRFTFEATGVDASGAQTTRQLQADVDTYGALESWYGLSINSSSNETVWVEEGEDAFEVVFRRWGHGIGMSQRGAQVMAGQGLPCADILGFYYPGTQLRTLLLTDTTGSGLHSGGAPEDMPIGSALCASGAGVV